VTEGVTLPGDARGDVVVPAYGDLRWGMAKGF
jgi:hypothetical protein